MDEKESKGDKKEKKGLLERAADSIREYFGPVPVLSGILGYGAVGMAAFAMYAIYNSSESIAGFLASGGSNIGNIDFVSMLYSAPGNIAEIYSRSSMASSQWSTPGFLAGQFLGYKLGSTLRSWFRRK